MSLNHKPPVTGFNPPLNVKKSEYSPQLPPKNGAKPLPKLGYNCAISSRLIKNSCGKGISCGETPASNNLLIGNAI